MYDDVFGGPLSFGTCSGPALSPRPEDYTEVFNGFLASRGASIPVLDLPPVDDSVEVMFDVRDPRFDYGDVFGGFDGLEFIASYEELIRSANGGDDSHDLDGNSSEEAWYAHYFFFNVLISLFLFFILVFSFMPILQLEMSKYWFFLFFFWWLLLRKLNMIAAAV